MLYMLNRIFDYHQLDECRYVQQKIKFLFFFEYDFIMYRLPC